MKSRRKDEEFDVAVKPAAKAVEKSSPGSALSRFEEMDMLFDRLSHGLMSRMGFPAFGEMGWPFQAHAPRVDMVDRGKDILIRAEMPGVRKQDLQIALTDNAVTIRSDTHKEAREEKGEYFRREISHGSFQRTLVLPTAVAGDAAKASFKDGVLELVLPKMDKPAGRKITIE